jgi:hypothetical protein
VIRFLDEPRIPERCDSCREEVESIEDQLGHCDSIFHYIELTGAKIDRKTNRMDATAFLELSCSGKLFFFDYYGNWRNVFVEC